MELPKEAPHQFTEINMNFLSDDDYKNLLLVSQSVKKTGRSNILGKLSDSLRKYQWFLIAKLRAQSIEETMLEMEVNSYIVMDPLAQGEFSKSIYEMMIYGKACLDSLAQFTSEFFILNEKPQSCDFKWSNFREKFEALEICSGLMNELDYWLNKDSKLTNSISSARDHWIHREYITVPLLWPPKELGCLVVPKLIEKDNLAKTTFTEEYFYSSNQFIELHQNNLSRLLSAVIKKTALVESKGIELSIGDDQIKNKVSFFPIGITEEREWNGITLGPYTSGSNK